MRKVLKQPDMTIDQMDLIELNEAFAAQAVACVQELGIDQKKLNVNGGAITLGHPPAGGHAVLRAAQKTGSQVRFGDPVCRRWLRQCVVLEKV